MHLLHSTCIAITEETQRQGAHVSGEMLLAYVYIGSAHHNDLSTRRSTQYRYKKTSLHETVTSEKPRLLNEATTLSYSPAAYSYLVVIVVLDEMVAI